MRTTLATSTALSLLVLTASASSAERAVPGTPTRTAEAPQTATGLSLRVDVAPGQVTLRRPQDLITHTRGLPGVYRGATDPLLAVALAEGNVEQAEGSWVHKDYRHTGPAGTARVIVSRLSPAVLMELPETTLRLVPAGAAASPGTRERDLPADAPAVGKLPRYLAAVEGGRAVVRRVSDLNQPASLRLDEPWVLVWFGPDTAARGHAEICDVDSKAGTHKALMGEPRGPLDVPLLLRWEHRPSAVRVQGGEVVFAFAEAVGKVAVMPLFGRRVWLPEETEAWRSALPEQVVRQCRLWSRWLRDFPLTVTETYEVEQSGDVLGLEEAFQWISLEDDWQTPPVKAAPVPPMLAVALGGNVPVSFLVGGKTVRPADGNLMDFAGKMMAVEGAEGYECRLEKLGQYLWQPSQPVSVVTEARPLQSRLEKQVAEMVASGHLRPLFVNHGGPGSWNASWYWVGTPETAHALARALPYLSAELQHRVREYVQAEWQQYPPLELDGRYYTEGAPREPYELDNVEQRRGVVRSRDEWYRRRNFWLDLYRIDAAASVIGGLPVDAKLRDRAAALAAELAGHLDWAILGPVRLRQLRSPQEARFTTLQGSAAYNAWLAGAIGLARLARKHDWQDQQRLASLLAGKLALARIAQARYVEEMHRMGSVRGKPEDDYRAVSHVDERCTIVRWGPLTTGVAEDQEFPPFIDLVPEVGRLLADYARPPCAVYLEYLDHAAPYWYLSEAPKQSATEHHLCPLWHQSGNVPAQAWILGKRGKEFGRYVDVTRFRGDLFAMENLVTAIEACGLIRHADAFPKTAPFYCLSADSRVPDCAACLAEPRLRAGSPTR